MDHKNLKYLFSAKGVELEITKVGGVGGLWLYDQLPPIDWWTVREDNSGP